MLGTLQKGSEVGSGSIVKSVTASSVEDAKEESDRERMLLGRMALAMISAAFGDVKNSPQRQRAMPQPAVSRTVPIRASAKNAQVKSASSTRFGRGCRSRL